MHYGKEFFKGSLSVCQEIVEDAIYEITHCNSQDLVGEAAQRAIEKRKKQEQKRIHAEYERQQLDDKYRRLGIFNKKIDKDRDNYKRKNDIFFLDSGYGLTLFFMWFFGMFVVKEISENAIIVWIFIAPFIMYFLFNKDKESKLNELAQIEHPYASMENIDKIIQKQQTNQKIQKYKKECYNKSSSSCHNLGIMYLTPPLCLAVKKKTTKIIPKHLSITKNLVT